MKEFEASQPLGRLANREDALSSTVDHPRTSKVRSCAPKPASTTHLTSKYTSYASILPRGSQIHTLQVQAPTRHLVSCEEICQYYRRPCFTVLLERWNVRVRERAVPRARCEVLHHTFQLQALINHFQVNNVDSIVNNFLAICVKTIIKIRQDTQPLRRIGMPHWSSDFIRPCHVSMHLFVS